MCVCVYVRTFACVCARWGGMYINGFHTLGALAALAGGEREARAFENERQSDAGGGDTASANLDSPVVYLQDGEARVLG